MNEKTTEKRALIEKEKFFLTCCRDKKTELRPGDSLFFLQYDHYSHLIMCRQEYAIDIKADDGSSILQKKSGDLWTREEVRMIATELAVAFGLDFKEIEIDNLVLKGEKNYIFKFF